MQFQIMAAQFPSFDQSTLPAIPANWVDVSWHNDVCPSFKCGYWRIFIEDANPDLREFPECKRYYVHPDHDNDAGTSSGIDTDNFQEVLDFIAKAARRKA